MKSIKIIILTSLFLLVKGFSYSQVKEIEVLVGWDNKLGICEGCFILNETKELLSSETIALGFRGSKEFSYEILNIEYENTIYQQLFNQYEIPSEPRLEFTFTKSRNNHFIVAVVSPLVFQNGLIKKVKNVKLRISLEASTDNNDREHVYSNNSVLNSGTWFKLGVDKTGVFKIDKTLLESMGVNVSTLNPNHINIYGNHISELPTNNNTSRPDDLMKNAITIVGENDGVFNDDDYIIFYATGPDQELERINSGFQRSLNDFDSLNYYFVSINSNEPPKRLSVQNESVTSSNLTSNDFNEITFYENDLVNLLKSGDLWLGEEFDVIKDQTFTLSTPDFVTGSSAKIKTTVARYSLSGSTTFSVNINNSNIDIINGSNTLGSYTKAVHNYSEKDFSINSVSTPVNLVLTNSNPSSKGWLDNIQINYRRKNSNATNQIRIRDWNSVGVGNVTNFVVSNTLSGTSIWDVTDPFNSLSQSITNSGTTKSFKIETDTLKSFVVFSNSQLFTPVFVKEVNNQNLHGLDQIDYLIIKHDIFTEQAERLANLHRGRGLKVHVLDVQDVYNEFSGGRTDPVAIRWVAKMFYDRSINNSSLLLKSMLLFGDGSYDAFNRLKDNDLTNFLPTYKSKASNVNDKAITLVTSYTSDDFFGILDDLESMDKSDLIDVSIGRFPVNSVEEARGVVDKIEHYMKFGSSLYSSSDGVVCDENGYSSSLGDWRGRTLLVADDENSGQFVIDCEKLSDSVDTKFPEMNVGKVYIDAYQQESTSSGQRYPEVENALNQIINTGTLVANYVGHGGEEGLSAEVIVSIPMIKAWTNINKLPLFISATCEFSRFDDPALVSAGEVMFVMPTGGAIGLLTTTRLVYINVNTDIVTNLYSNLFKIENGKALTMGEIIRRTKNLTAGDENMRNFTLLGDPALELGRPLPSILAEKINGIPINGSVDTIKALSKIEIEARVVDNNGNLISDFNGLAYPTVYDKELDRKTLGQDSKSPILSYKDRSSVLYKGKSTVKNGKFKFSFVVPKDINYSYGNGKLSFYAENGTSQKIGHDNSIIIGGVNPDGLSDVVGPEIELYMNDFNFVSGGITDENPTFIAKLIDENGINTTGNGIGHDIILIIDNQTSTPYILNNYYEADLDTYQSGEVRFKLIDLEPGIHTAKFKAWDVNNNSSEVVIEFEVKQKDELAISHLLNYPNPFTTYTEFFFEHNQVCNQLETKIEIFTVTGKLVKSIIQTVNSSGFRTDGIAWDGRDEYGDKLARGVYVYRLSIETNSGEKSEKIEKLVIL